MYINLLFILSVA